MSKRRSSRARSTLLKILPAALAVAVLVGYTVWSSVSAPHRAAALTVVAVQPRDPRTAPPVEADVENEVGDTSDTSSDVLVLEMAGDSALPAYTGTFFCGANVDALTCDQRRKDTRRSLEASLWL